MQNDRMGGKKRELRGREITRKPYIVFLEATLEMILSELALLRARALRKNVWFKALSRLERSIAEIAIKSLNTITSEKLISVLKGILEKLLRALESPVRALAKTVGRQLASLMAGVARSWGNLRACGWVRDERFATFLAVCYLNTPTYYRYYHG